MADNRITIQAEFGQNYKDLGFVGRVGENDSREIAFDCADVLTQFTGASIVCVIKRACDTKPYSAVLMENKNSRILPLSAVENAVAGQIMIELRAVSNDTILKSAMFSGRISESLQGEGDRPGAPVRDVLDRVDSALQSATETQKKLLSALDGVDTAVDGANTAAENAQAVADTIQAKLDNGDFVGPAGKPGSDASVTAENIQSALGYTPVKDVQMDGESLVQDSVATIPLAGYNRLGVVKLDPAGFAAASVEGMLSLVPPTDAQISTHTHTQRPITPSCMDYAVKAAMCDGKGAAWTAVEQKAARERMGIDKAYELIETITADGTAIVERTQEPDGTPYNFVAVKAMITSPKALSDTKTVYGRIFCGQISNSTFSLFEANSNYFLRATYTWEKKHNIIAGIVNVSTYIYGAQDGYGGDYSSARIIPDVIVADENFTKLKVYSVNNQPVPAGFLIQIYGVRA